jgi:alpha,alpha-trehalose phosphorylase
VRRYVAATGDSELERGPGAELLVETARLWRSLGHHDAEGCFRIDGVTGPDEYTALVDNNVFTNLMAARNLRTAADVASRYPERAAELGVDAREIAAWRAAADNMVVPYDAELGVTAQSEGFTRYRRWDFESTRPEEYPLLLHYPYYLLYSSQVVKQADLVLALYLCGDRFTPEQKRRDFDYYEGITVRDSSLSASIQAIVAAEVGHLDLAYEYFLETALIDLHDRAGNTADGLHLAALAGALHVAVAGFGGMRDYGDVLAFSPRLPEQLTGLAFRLLYRGRRIRVDVGADHARYELLAGEPIDLLHHGETVTLAPASPQTLACPERPECSPVEPPPGRAAGGRGVGGDATAARMTPPPRQ